MQDIDAGLQLWRSQTMGWLDRLLYRQRPELLDLDPESAGAQCVRRDLERFAARSGLSSRLAAHACSLLGPAQPGVTCSVLELAAGTGWLSRAILQHAASGGMPVRVTTTDLHVPYPLPESAAQHWLVADATALPFPDQSYDLVVCAQALHHLPPLGVVQLLSQAARVGRKVAVFDLRRTFLGVAMMAVLAPFYSPEFIADGITSHRRAYSLQEMQYLLDRARPGLRVRAFMPVGMMVECAELQP